MSVVINTNTSASVAANNLAYSNAQLQKSLNKLSSGSKIVSPSDDAGGLAVSEKLTATVNREADLQNNLSDVTSYAQTQDGALQVAASILDRSSQLYTLYQDPTKNSSDLGELQRRVHATPVGIVLARQPVVQRRRPVRGELLHGVRHGRSRHLRRRHRRAAKPVDTAAGLGAVLTNGGTTAISGLGNITGSLATITTAIQNVASMRANNGAEQSRLGFASTMLTTNSTNLQSAISSITTSTSPRKPPTWRSGMCSCKPARQC